jgi:hypothetical protein
MELEEEKTFTLRKPLVLGKGEEAVTYDTLTLREPNAGELEKATKEGTNVGVSITLIALIARIPRKAVEQLSQRDLREVSDYLGGFTEGGPEAGPME